MHNPMQGGSIINPFAPKEVNIKIKTDLQTGQATMAADLVLPATTIIGILAALISTMSRDLEKNMVKNLQSEDLYLEDKKEHGKNDDNNEGN